MRFTSKGTSAFSPIEDVELILTALCLLIAFLRPTFGTSVFARVEMALLWVSEKRWLPPLLIAILPVVIRLAILPIYSHATPYVHDEYAYILQADTFAAGRITNPTPPFWQHFVSIYVLAQPTYSSEYQPAQGAFFALGQVLTGSPWAGVLLSMSAFCLCLYWVVLAWLPRLWALAGTLTVAVEIGVLSYWANSYWGGFVPAIGGALAAGAFPRLSRSGWYAAVLGLGIALLVNSRPLEGVLLAGAAGAVILARRAYRTRRVIVPLVLIGMATMAFAAFYNKQVTGSPAVFPYALYRARFGTPQGFLWQKPLPAPGPMPTDIRAEYDDQLEQDARRNSLGTLVRLTLAKMRRFWCFFIGVPLTIPLIFSIVKWRKTDWRKRIWRDPNLLFTALSLMVVLIFDNLTFFAYFAHYSAAVGAAVFLIVIWSIQQMRQTGSAGLFLSRALPSVCVLGLLMPITGRLLHQTFWDSEFLFPRSREKFAPWLEAMPGKQLVMVRYDPATHENANAWVYNQADIEHAKVIWARELDDAESNRRLLAHFAGRKVWLAEPDRKPQRITPFSSKP